MNIRRPLWIGCLVLVGCSRGATPAKSPIGGIIPDEQGGVVEIETIIRDTTEVSDTIYIREQIQCKPETIYVAKRIKVKDSYNVDNSEITKLKTAVLVRDSQIDSLNIQLGKKCIGEQTNNGHKWWIFVILGMVIGTTGYQAIRSAITKKW